MSDAVQQLVKQYSSVLQDYVRGPKEALRERAYQLGHEAIASGLGLLDVTAAYQEALLRMLAATRTLESSVQTEQRASEFLLESLVPFEMTHRGYKETIHMLMSANEALRKSEAKNLALLNAIPDIMFRIGADGTYLDFKAGRSAGMTLSASAVVGRMASEILPSRLAEQVMGYVARALETGTIQVFEYQLMVDGDQRDYETRLAISGKDEVLGIVRDVTARRRAEQEHAKLIREQAARAEAQAAQERISNILESITDGFVALDSDWRYTYVNQQAERILRSKREQLLGRNIWQAMPEVVGSTFEEEFRRAVDEQVTVHFRDFYPPLDAWFEVHAYPSRDGLSIYFRDITEQRHHERARLGLARIGREIAAAQDAEQALVVAVTELVASFDIDLARIWLWNADEQALVLQSSAGLSARNAATGSRFGRFRLGETKIGAIAASRQPLWSNELQSESWLLNREWAKRTGIIAFAGFPLLVGDQLLGVMGLFSRRAFDDDDLTALATLAENLSVAIEKARLITKVRGALKLREEFIHAATHELRTPVTILTGYVDLLQRSPNPSSPLFSRALRAVQMSADRVAQLAHDLVEADALERGTMALHVARFDLAELARQVVETAAAEQPDYRFSMRTMSSVIIADREQIGQVIRHLLDNAMKYQPQAGDIDVMVGIEHEHAVLTVQDHGLGIAPERQPHLFEPMYEPIPPGSVGYVGVVGLGLMISKRIVELHGGRIWLESEPGKGSTFHIALPLPEPSMEEAPDKGDEE